MNARTLKALKASIEHWKRHANGTAKFTEQVYAPDCALCEMFLVSDCNDENRCHGCPIMERTGKAMCADTPWLKAELRYWRSPKGKSAQFKAAAKEMVKFLKSLLPKTRKPKTRKVAK